MTMRTVKINGLAYGSTPANITISLDGNIIFSGDIATQDSAVPALPDPALVDSQATFCTFELPVDFAGQKPMTCTVNSGTVVFGTITANYNKFPDPTQPSGYVGMGPDVYINIDSDQGDARGNVTIDGIAQTDHPAGTPLTGTWWWTVNSGSVLAYDVQVDAGIDTNPPA